MLAILGGLGAAVAFAASTLASTRSSRLIGSAATVGWVTLVGLPVALVAVLPDVARVTPGAAPWLAIAGVGNVVGLILAYQALRIGRVGVVAPLVATEGAIAAVIAFFAGAAMGAGVAIGLAVIVVGGAMTAAAAAPDPHADPDLRRQRPLLSVGLAVLAAACFGAGLYATGRISQALPLGWVLLSPRVAGTLLVAAPLAATRRLRITRPAVPTVVTAGLAEVIGFGCIGLGAASDIAVTSVLASQFAALAAIGAVFVFGERMRATQKLGVLAIAIGTALVAALSR